MKRFLTAVAAVSAAAWAGYAQEMLREGDASYASYTPWSKARTFGPDGKVVRRGDQSRIMQNRPLYLVDLFRRLLADYAERGNFGGDTYWGGKGLFQMVAREIGDAATFAKARERLRAQFEDWLTWTPGEDKFYFSYIPRWGGLVGENTSYDSDAFNDHHFHYGYFTWSGALLCLVDEDFNARTHHL